LRSVIATFSLFEAPRSPRHSPGSPIITRVGEAEPLSLPIHEARDVSRACAPDSSSSALTKPGTEEQPADRPQPNQSAARRRGTPQTARPRPPPSAPHIPPDLAGCRAEHPLKRDPSILARHHNWIVRLLPVCYRRRANPSTPEGGEPSLPLRPVTSRTSSGPPRPLRREGVAQTWLDQLASFGGGAPKRRHIACAPGPTWTTPPLLRLPKLRVP
jgi:hypothetical protein